MTPTHTEPVAVAPQVRAADRTWTHRHPRLFLAAFLLLSVATGLDAAFVTRPRESWYAHLQRPTYGPPAWVFAPAWALAAATVGVAAWLVWRHHRTWQRDVALRWWTVQLLLGAAWIPVFLVAHRPVWGLVDLGVLVVVTAITAVRFLPFDRRASALFLLYLAWLAYLVTVNVAIVAMN